MKCLLLIVVLAALSASNDASIIQDAVKSNLVVGNINSADRLLYRNYYSRNPIVNAIQYQDITFRGNSSTRISSVRATEVGYTQYASAFITSGGVGRNTVTVRLQSYRGYGYYFMVEVWGR